MPWSDHIQSFDTRRDIIIPGDAAETISFCVSHFIETGQEAIRTRGLFTVALSGGETPLAMFRELARRHAREKDEQHVSSTMTSSTMTSSSLDWSKVLCFWSDERSVSPTHSESNYGAAMAAGLASLPLLPHHLFRMEAEHDIESNAMRYEMLIRQHVPQCSFDLLMLGMGTDGHIASLFPETHALHASHQLVTANYLPTQHTWRMSLTYECIHAARTICLYVLGEKKGSTVREVLLGPYQPDRLPAQRVGTPTHKALWILDTAASTLLTSAMEQALQATEGSISGGESAAIGHAQITKSSLEEGTSYGDIDDSPYV